MYLLLGSQGKKVQIAYAIKCFMFKLGGKKRISLEIKIESLIGKQIKQGDWR